MIQKFFVTLTPKRAISDDVSQIYSNTQIYVRILHECTDPAPDIHTIVQCSQSHRGEHFYVHCRCEKKFITGQNEREESTQNTTVSKSAACKL